MQSSRAALALAAVLLAGACKKGEITIEPAPVVSDAALLAGKQLYAERCVSCHGEQGRGDGPKAPRPRPTNLSDPLWHSNVTNERLRQVLIGGGGVVGKSVLMPANPDLARRPEDLDGLVAYIRGLRAR